MTDKDAPPEKRRRSLAGWIVAALVVMTIAAIGGWLYTVRELNHLAAHKAVGTEALRMARAALREPPPVPAIYAGKWE